jgi:hypothetical protein
LIKELLSEIYEEKKEQENDQLIGSHVSKLPNILFVSYVTFKKLFNTLTMA